MSLERYQSMRSFDKTPEPQGEEHKPASELAFVIQKHEASHLHYDFRLEMNGVMVSWAVPKGPSLNPQDKRLAMQVEDHPYDYRTFEGIIPQGEYGGGTVMVWDEGTYTPYSPTGDISNDEKTLRQGWHKGHLTFILHGKKLQGEWALIKKSGDDKAWFLVKAGDKFASSTDITDQDRSAASKRTMEEIAAGQATWTQAPDLSDAPKKTMPANLKPMLATLADTAFDSDDWLYEIKWDGYRGIAYLNDGQVLLKSRNAKDFAAKYPVITEALSEIRGTQAILDGEIVALDPEGHADFGALQDYAAGKSTIAYYVFDLLYLNGQDLTGLPLIQRKNILRRWLPTSEVVRFSDHIVGQGKAFLELSSQQKLEGIMAKKSNSSYEAGKRSRNWLKLKNHARQEAVIGGFTAPRNGRSNFGALVLGVYDGKDLKYIGHTGGGFNDRSLAEVYSKLTKLQTDKSPFDDKFKLNSPVTWVRPKLVCEIQFAEWTKDRHMRQPIFMGLREDKIPTSVYRETAQVIETAETPKPQPAKLKGDNMKLTNLDKVFWPDEGFTKGDLIDFYRDMAPYILPYLKDRPQSMHRFPNGIKGQSFYQKDMGEKIPEGLQTFCVHSEGEDRDLNYLICNDIDTLLYMINLGCIELNPWNSRTKTNEKPDWCVIDLDPEGVDFPGVIEVAQNVHEVLLASGIPSYPKTSGATGIHIYIPLGAKYNYEQSKEFAHVIAQIVNRRLPNLTSLERSPSKRQKRVYLDYLQNRKGQTLAAPYCVRPQPGMTVSTPLEWGEVKTGLSPNAFTVKTIGLRLKEKGDIWQPVIGQGIDMLAALDRLGGM